jgi:3'(2'), 5'-bisphosphate nucleotidase
MDAMSDRLLSLLDHTRVLAQDAGKAILAVYGHDDPGTREKADRTPVTEADLRAETLILKGLAELTPEIPVVAEERVAAGEVPADLGDLFWLVDPLDGTKEFLSRNGEFTVNIALVQHGEPILGVVHAPAIGATYAGLCPAGDGADSHGVHRAEVTDAAGTRPLAVTSPPAEGLRALVSRSHLDPDTERWLGALAISSYVQAGSSLKFCRIAEGAADIYPRFGRTMEWDTAAGHAVLKAAGGEVRTVDGAPLRYGKDNFANPAFVAYVRNSPVKLGIGH